jgi:hypothetical protein
MKINFVLQSMFTHYNIDKNECQLEQSKISNLLTNN